MSVRRSEPWWHIVAKVANLLLALFVLAPMVRTIDDPWNVLGVVLTVVTGVWVLASVWLFSEWRFGWYGSVIGTGTMLMCVLVPVCRDILLFLVGREGVGVGKVVETMKAGSLGVMIVLPIFLGLVYMRFTRVPPKRTC